MESTRPFRVLISLAVPLMFAGAACSSTKTIESAASDSVLHTTVDSTADTVAVTTPLPTDPPVTVPAPTVVLRIDGLGVVSFGDEQGTVLTALAGLLGPTVTDEFLDFSVDNGFGFFESTDGDLGFIFPTARLSCYVNQFCVTFGGETPDTVVFVGWSFRGSPDPTAPTTDVGITLGSLQSDFSGELTAFEGGCFTVGAGATNDGILLALLSSGQPFFEFDESGNPVNNVPDPSEVSVMSMESGTQLLDLVGDC